MAISSLSTSSISALAQSGLNTATDQISASTYRLSSGDRFYRAGDDVAALSISTRLQSDVTAGRQALLNNSQADSLLQVAYGGLSEISGILDDMKALAVSANSGALTAAERASLDLQFQNYKDEIDSISESTNFGGIALLDGSVDSTNDMSTNDSNATQSTGSISFTANIGANRTVVLNGVTFTEGTDFNRVGGDTNASVSNLADALNASTDLAVSQATYQAVGNSITITQRPGGRLGDTFIIDQANSTATFTTSGDITTRASTYVLAGGEDDGIFQGGSVISGAVGDSLITTQDQTRANATLSFSANAADGETFDIDDGDGGTITFTFRAAAGAADEIQIGADVEETLQNAVDTIETYRDTNANSDTYVLNQIEFEIDGNSLNIYNRQSGDVEDLDNVVADLAEGIANATLSSTTLGNGANTGINVSGLTNPDAVGTISGFTATFNAADDITASITIGSSTYSANITDTTPGATTPTRFLSSDGGYFDVELAAAGQAVANQAGADTYASRLDTAFSTMTIYQSRDVDNFSGVGDFADASAQFQTDDFSSATMSDLSIVSSATAGGDAVIEAEIEGETFRTSNLGDGIGANETITLTSLENGNRELRIVNGSVAIDLSTDTTAADAEDDLRSAFGLENGATELSFQIGASSESTLSVSIGNASSSSLFDGATPDLTTASNAASAETVVDSAIDEITEIMAEVGSKQSVLQYAYNALDSNINEIDAARAELADTDIASESVAYADAIVQQQAAISVLAQTQLLGSNLLGLIEVSR